MSEPSSRLIYCSRTWSEKREETKRKEGKGRGTKEHLRKPRLHKTSTNFRAFGVKGDGKGQHGVSGFSLASSIDNLLVPLIKKNEIRGKKEKTKEKQTKK